MIRVTAVLFFGSVLLSLAQTPEQTGIQTAAETATGAAAQLASRISSLLPRRATVSLEVQTLTSLPAAEWSNFRNLLQSELQKSGIETAATPRESRVQVTLTETSHGLLFIAEVLVGDSRQIAMMPWTQPSPERAKPPVRLVQAPLWSFSQPILDVLDIEADSAMLVLTSSQVILYRMTNGKWTQSATASLVLPRPMPRDPRGRFEATTDGFQVFLPVATCTGSSNPELKLTCGSGTANWPGTIRTHWLADRNVLESDASAPNFEGWGSDTATIADPCGAGTVVVASGPNNEHDSVRAYLIRDGQADPASDALPLPGPVTALWPAESRREATLVVRNLQTGEYEASRLLLACNQ